MIKAKVRFVIIAAMLLDLLSVTIYAESAHGSVFSFTRGSLPGDNTVLTAGMNAANDPLQDESSIGTLFTNTNSPEDTLTLKDSTEAGAPIGREGSQMALFAANTWIFVSPASGAYTGTVTLSATLRKLIPPTATVSGRTIIFKLDDRTVGSAVTDKDGVATLPDVRLPDNLNVGIHLDAIHAEFAGDGSYKKSSGIGVLTVTYAPTELRVDNITAPFGSTVTVRSTLISSFTGKGLKDKVITVLINDEIKGMTATDADGVAVMDIDLGSMSVGTYPILVTFLQVIGNYSPNTATATLRIGERPTSLAVENAAGIYGDTVTLRAALSSLGLPLENRTVTFSVNGNPVGTSQTLSDGTASLQFSLAGIDAGSYPGAIKAEFAAENYAPSSASGDLIVQQAPSSVVVLNATGTYDGKVTLSARLTAASSNTPLSGRTLYFKLNGTDKGSAVTGDDGLAALPEVSIAGIPVGTYDDYIEAAFTPLDGNYAPASGKGRLEVSMAATCITVNKITAVYGSKVDLEATLTAYDAPLPGKPIEFRINGQFVGAAITGADGKAVKNCIDLTGLSAGIHPGAFCATFVEADPYKGCSSYADIEITKACTWVSVGDAEVQYSDLVTVTAVVTSAAQENLNCSGGRVEFKYQLKNGPMNTLGTASQAEVRDGHLRFSFEFACGLDPDTYKILAEFTPSDQENFNSSCNKAPYGSLLVEAENALVEYTGPQYFSAPSCGSAAVTLSAAIIDTNDCSRGDISNARVEFREAALGALYNDWEVQATNLPVFLTNPADNTIGSSTTQPFSRTLGQAEVNGTIFDVYTKVRGNYTRLSSPSLVTIGIPGDNHISGGGFVVPDLPAGKYRAKLGSKTDFGFTMKYDKSCQNVPGLVSLIIRGENGKIYQVNSTSVNSLSAYTIDKMPGKAASFTASAELIDITDPFNMVTLGRDLCLTIGIYEESTDKQMNAISITLLGENSELLYSNNWDGSKTLPQRLNMNNGSGTIKVLGSAVLSSVEGEKVIPKEYALFQNYPNPFNPSTTIQYDLPEDSRVRIAVYDILGKEVSLIADGEIPAGRHQAVWNSQDHGSFASGIYILRISAESLNSSKNLISTKKMLLIK
ncbi:MAG: T9SS type A sorting domain-containing protein [Bacteroidota bacterium]